MKKLSTTPDLLSRYAVLGSFIVNGFALRPTVQGVVAKILKDELTSLYPFLTPNFSRLFIAEPIPALDAISTNGQPQRFRFMSPVDVMIQRYIDATPITLRQGFHRLTLGEQALDPHPLAVDMSDLQSIINDAAPVLLEAYQQALLHFWSTESATGVSPFKWLAQRLQAAMTAAAVDRNRVPALEDEQAVVLAVVSSFADKTQRLLMAEETPLHAYLVGVEYESKGTTRRLMLAGESLMTRQMPERLHILGYSIGRGSESFRAMDTVGATLKERLQGTIEAQSFTWSLYEPEGNYFHALALTLLDQQLQDLHGISQQAQRERWSAGLLEQTLDDAGAMFPIFSPQEQPYFDHVISKLPAWLQKADAVDLLAYSKLMLAMVIGQKQTGGKTFLEGIDTLPAFAEQLIRLRFESEHPSNKVEVSHIEVDELGVENLSLPRFTQNVSTLAEFMLTYRGAWPIGLVDVRDRRGRPLPDWLGSGYVKALVDELDVGTRYIALLQRLLVDDEAEVVTRKALFKTQLSVQLPLLALEKKIKGEAGITRAGWERINLLMRPDSELTSTQLTVCIRPLGFYAYEGGEAHYVENMFILGSIDTLTGPFIVYRPFFSEPLLEFSTWPALSAAIQQPGELQESVLAWMSDDARPYFAEGGFIRPHLENRDLEALLLILPRSPAILVTQSVQGDYFEYLFDINATALMTLAGKQTLSTSERRWGLLKRSGWALFNGLTFFVSGPLQRTLWLVQTLFAIEESLQARIEGDKEGATQTIIDVLFNISLALMHEGLKFKTKANERPRLKAPIDEALFKVDEVLTFDEAVAPARTPLPKARLLARKRHQVLDEAEATTFFDLDFSWFGPNTRLTPRQRAELDTFAVDVDLTQGTMLDIDPLKGVITFQEKSYVQVDGKTYRVQRQADGLVVQDDKQPLRLGPRLIRDDLGQWRLDLRLRLNGGGPKKRIQALRQEKLQKAEALVQQADSLLDEIERTDRVLMVTENLLETASERRAQLLDRFETELSIWRRKVLDVIDIKSRIHQLVPIEDYERKSQETWVRLTLKLFKLQNYLESSLREVPVYNSHLDYWSGLKSVLSRVAAGDRGPYERWVEHLKQAEKLEVRLYKNSINETEALSEVQKRPLPKESPLKEIMVKPDRDYFDRHWVAAYLETLSELLIVRGATNLTFEEQYAFDMFGKGELVDSAWSQINLRHQEQLLASEHLEFFDSIIKQYGRAELFCASLMELGSEHFRNEYFPSTIQVLRTLRNFAESQMANVIRDSESSSSADDEPRPGPSRSVYLQPATAESAGPAQVVIKTTRNQTLIGQKRTSPQGVDEEIVDITAGINQLNLRSYRKTAAGNWEEISTPRPDTLQVKQIKTLNKLEAEARTLLRQFRDVIERTRASAGTAKIPVEIQEILDFKAQSLEEVAGSIERIAASASPSYESLTDERRTAIRAMSFNLKSAATRLHEEGKNLRIKMIKRLAPTGPNVDYLMNEGEVRISRLGPRKHLSKGQRKDYLQEYVVRNQDGTDLWFAHFHYPALDTPGENFTAAHLKTAQQRTLSEQALYARAQSPNDYIEVYRAKLDTALATKLFLSLP